MPSLTLPFECGTCCGCESNTSPTLTLRFTGVQVCVCPTGGGYYLFSGVLNDVDYTLTWNGSQWVGTGGLMTADLCSGSGPQTGILSLGIYCFDYEGTSQYAISAVFWENEFTVFVLFTGIASRTGLSAPNLEDCAAVFGFTVGHGGTAVISRP